MSIIRTIKVSLTEIVEESNLIVEVKYNTKFTESIPVKDKDGNIAPPFIKQGIRFDIVNVIKSDPKNQVPSSIEVPDANWRRFLSQHKEMYIGGPSKSFNVKEYVTEVSSMKNATILFLYQFQDTFELTAKYSYESAAIREKLDILLGN